jgi:hypothetical protein
MDSIDLIQSSISSIDPHANNNTSDIYLNIINNEFITIEETFTVPKISVSELDYKTAESIVTSAIKQIPEFLINHELLSKRKPSSEQHYLHFIQPLRGKHIYFLHLFKLDLEFGGNTEAIIEQGDSDNYPSFKTDRYYYKSKLLPVNSTLKKDESIIDFTTIRLVQKEQHETDQHFHTFAIFDETDSKKNSLELSQLAGLDRYKVSQKLYPFISYEYFTAVFNILYPTPEEISIAMEIFEPVFISIYSKSFNWKDLISEDALNEKFPETLTIEENYLVISDNLREKMDSYFNRFSLFRDDEMALKGWRRFNISD